MLASLVPTEAKCLLGMSGICEASFTNFSLVLESSYVFKIPLSAIQQLTHSFPSFFHVSNIMFEMLVLISLFTGPN